MIGWARRTLLPGGSVLVGYLTRELLSKVFATAAVIIALMEVLALLEQVTEIMSRHLGLSGVLYYAVIRLPLLFGNAMPLAVLIGALITLVHLTSSNEISILRAAGLSTPGLFRLFMPAVLGLGLLCVAVDDQLVPRSEIAQARWWNSTNPSPNGVSRDVWFRTGMTLVNIGGVAHGGRELHDVTVYRREDDGSLQKVIHLPTVRYFINRWSGVPDHSLTVLSPTRVEQADNTDETRLVLDWPQALTPDVLLQLSENTPLSISTMLRVLRNEFPSSQSPAFFMTEILGRIMLPLTFTVMLLLAIPVVYIPPRAGTRSWLPVWCLGAGLVFVVFQGLLRALGNAGTLPSVVAVFVGIVIFILGVVTVLLRIEER
ncbi:LptF/LptG family permease [Komagataeibacter sp. FNDCR1]|nr:LptF/LptG family permease [Komagataeibacter sp. FNDCR1]